MEEEQLAELVEEVVRESLEGEPAAEAVLLKGE